MASLAALNSTQTNQRKVIEIVKIKLKKGSNVKNKAPLIYSVLETIRKKNGGNITPGLIVDASRSKTAKLHNEFEWDNKKAGELFRCEQARAVLRSIEVVYDEAPQTPVRFYSVQTVVETDTEPQASKRVYTSTREMMADPEGRDQVLARAIREAGAFMERYANLQELAQVFDAIKATTAKIAKRKMA